MTEQEVWWDSLSTDVQDAISRTLFLKQIFDLDKAYNTYKDTLT